MYIGSDTLRRSSTLHLRHTSVRPKAIQRSSLDFAVLLAGITALAIVIMLVGWQLWHVNRIYSGVTVAGVAVGGLTRAEAMGQLQKHSAYITLPNVTVTLDVQQWSLTAEQRLGSANWLAAINQAYLIGRQGTYLARLRTQTAAAVGTASITPKLQLDSGELHNFVSQIATEVRRPGHRAMLLNGTEVPAQPGVDVDIEDTMQHIQLALDEQQDASIIRVPLEIFQIKPPETTQDHPTGSVHIQNRSSQPSSFLLHNDAFQLKFAIDTITWSNLVVSENPLRLDEAKLGIVLESWANQIAIPARDARLHFDTATNQVVVLQESLPGRRMDVAATVATVREAATAGHNIAHLVVVSVMPEVDSTRIAEMGIRELVMSNTTYFAGSTKDRIHNIEVAAEQFEGVVIPPEGIFSFNQLVGDVSAANGFEDSLIIWGDRTAVGIGGGVCQVSTTIFRAAYEAGMPIVERYNHGYVVDWYGDPGFDATIYTPTVDFKFRNDTGAHLLVEPVVDIAQGTMTFNLYGTKPDRQVTIHEPVITDYTEPRDPQYIVDTSLSPGEQQQVEWPQAGMTVTIQRTIVENGQTRTDTLTSIYQPWRALYLVGPKASAAAPEVALALSHAP